MAGKKNRIVKTNDDPYNIVEILGASEANHTEYIKALEPEYKSAPEAPAFMTGVMTETEEPLTVPTEETVSEPTEEMPAEEKMEEVEIPAVKKAGRGRPPKSKADSDKPRKTEKAEKPKKPEKETPDVAEKESGRKMQFNTKLSVDAVYQLKRIALEHHVTASSILEELITKHYKELNLDK